MTAVVKKEFNHMYQSEGPVLYAVSVKQTEPPEEEVATFYSIRRRLLAAERRVIL